jgi:DNA-binding NtrC family response regulator
METILVVEDDDSIRECLEEILAEQGYQVEVAENGLEALKKIKARPGKYGVMLLDIRMPVMDGPELLRHLVDHDLVIPTVIISAAKEMLDLGPIPWLKKPFEIDDLYKAIRKCTESPVNGGGDRERCRPSL